ncbi:MAG TPA: DUF3108 domain-containing protein [Bryobacteraceae bacterium]|nr:DUF3108 domain-containing protein [Bryobacteraceae bacterium]
MRLSAGVVVLLAACWLLPGQSSSSRRAASAGKKAAPVADLKPEPPPDPTPVKTPSERLTYDIEWRLIHAGSAVIDAQKSHAELKLESAGMVSTLFKVHDLYSVNYEDPFCATSSMMDSFEGKRHHETRITYDRGQNRASYLERDVIRNVVLHSDEVATPNCVHEVIGAILKLRGMTLEPGQSTLIPMSDGRRSAGVKVEAQEREKVSTPAGDFKTIRYDAGMLNGVVYTRKGRALLWLTDDSRHLPVQIRLRMQFPIGTVTLQLEKEEHP